MRTLTLLVFALVPSLLPAPADARTQARTTAAGRTTPVRSPDFLAGQEGRRLRLTDLSDPGAAPRDGRVDRIRGDTVFLWMARQEAPVPLVVGRTTRVEEWRRSTHERDLGILGGILGGIAGAVIAARTWEPEEPRPCEARSLGEAVVVCVFVGQLATASDDFLDQTFTVLGGWSAGMFGGALIGREIGKAVATEGWAPLRVGRIGVGRARTGGAEVRLEILPAWP